VCSAPFSVYRTEKQYNRGVHNDNDLWQQSNRCHLSSMSIEGDLTITAGEATKMR